MLEISFVMKIFFFLFLFGGSVVFSQRAGAYEKISKGLLTKVDSIRSNTVIETDMDCFNIHSDSNMILLIYATWSAYAKINCSNALKFLYEKNYQGKIHIVDVDCLHGPFKGTDYNVGHSGAGEILIIENGVFTEKFIYAESFINFKQWYVSQ